MVELVIENELIRWHWICGQGIDKIQNVLRLTPDASRGFSMYRTTCTVYQSLYSYCMMFAVCLSAFVVFVVRCCGRRGFKDRRNITCFFSTGVPVHTSASSLLRSTVVLQEICIQHTRSYVHDVQEQDTRLILLGTTVLHRTVPLLRTTLLNYCVAAN